MKKIIGILAFTFCMSANMGAINKSELVKSDAVVAEKDVCTITVTIYHDGEEMGSGTYTDNTGDCEIAEANAYLIAWMLS